MTPRAEQLGLGLEPSAPSRAERLERAQALARAELARHGLDTWTFAFDRAVTRAGVCYYRARRLCLSRVFVEANGEKVVLDTIRHEVAHALAWERDRETGHGAAWRRWCEVTGAEPRRCRDAEELEMPAGRYRCTVIATEAPWPRGRGPNRRSGVARIGLEKGTEFERHRLTRRLRQAVALGLVEVVDRRTGLPVEVNRTERTP